MTRTTRSLSAAVAALMAVAQPLIAGEAIDLPVTPDERPISGTHHLLDVFAEKIAEFAELPFEAGPRAEPEGIPIGGWNTFFSMDMTRNAPIQVRAQLRGIGEHCYLYVQEGHEVSDATIERLQQEFDQKIYPTNHEYFGSEWKPGIDWDPRITLLLMDIQDGWTPGRGYVAGYFFPLDEASTRLFDFSNEREIFYLDIYPGDPSREDYMGILAHEFQHMIHANHDRRETRWLNEALAQIAFYVNGYGHAPQTFSFAKSSDTALIEFDNGLDDYGSVYLWTYYLLTKYAGDDPAAQAAFTRALVASQEKGMAAFNEVLASIGAPSAGEIFQDWVIANAANAPSILSGKYGYDSSLAFKVQPTTVHPLDGRTGKVKTDVLPWAADTITFVPEVLYSPLNPTMADRVTLLAKGGAEEISWTINGGQVPPQALLPEGSRVEDGRAVSPVVASDAGDGVVLGHFMRKGVKVESVEFFNGSAQVSVPVYSLDKLTDIGAPAWGEDFSIKFGGKTDELTITALVSRNGGLEVVPVEDERFELESLAGVEKLSFVVAGNPAEKAKPKDYWYKASGDLGEGSALRRAARLREVEDRLNELGADPASRAALAEVTALRRATEERLAASMVATAGDEALAAAGEAFVSEGRLRTRMIASAKAALRMARFRAMERAESEGVPAAAVQALEAGAPGTEGDDEDDAHDNMGYLLFKAGEVVHELDHLKIDPQLLEGQILKLWRLLEIARGFPHLPIPDGLNVRDYDLGGVREIMQQWAADFDVDGEWGALPGERPVPTAGEEDVKATLRRLRLAATVVELTYADSLLMADDLTTSVYDFVRLIFHAWKTTGDIAKVFERIPIVGKAVRYLKGVIHRKLVRVVEILLIRLSAKLKAPYNQYAPMVISLAAWAYARFLMKLPDDPRDPRQTGAWEFAVKLMGRYALTAVPRIGYVERGQPEVDLMKQYTAELTHEGTLEEAFRRVIDDGSSQTQGAVREKFLAELEDRHGTFVRNRKIVDITRRIVSIGQYASAIDPTNISRIVTVVAGAVSTGLLAHSGYRTGSLFFKAHDQFVEPGVRLAFDPGLLAEGADEAPELQAAFGPDVRARTMARLEGAFEDFEEALRVARASAGFRADRVASGAGTEDVDQEFLAAAERLDAADRELDDAMGLALALGFAGEDAEVESGLLSASTVEAMQRADAVSRVLARGLGEGPRELDPAAEAARQQGIRAFFGVLRANLQALEARGSMDAQVVVSESQVEASEDRLVVRAVVANPSGSDLHDVTVEVQSGYHFGFQGPAVAEVGTLPAGETREVQWTLVPEEELGFLPLASLVPAASDGKGVGKLVVLR